MRIGLYPGTFDPVTNGHMDIIGRAVKLVDRLVIGVARNDEKGPMFTTDQRVEMVRAEVAYLGPRVEVRPFSSLLMHFAEELDAGIIVRGLRAVADFEYEFQMAGMNRQLMPEVETVFMTPSDQFQFVSGTFVREIASLGGDVSKFVAPSVLRRLKERVSQPDS